MDDNCFEYIVKIMNILKKYWIVITGAVLGIAGGFLYWKYVGCLSGTCPLKSNLMIMTIYGGALGYFLSSLLQDFLFRRRKPNQN